VPLPADVLVAGQLADHEAAQLVHEFETVGLTAELREVAPRRSLGDIAWLALLAVPLKPFYEQLAKDFATDAHQRLKTLTGKLCQRAAKPTGSSRVIVLQDSTTGVQVALEPDLPDEAFEQLLTFDLATIRRGPLHYDRHRRQWRSELDEADTASSLSAKIT
jgi:hypothetical protein